MKNDLLEHAGNQIKHYRKARGMTIDELSKKIHKSRGTVSKYESGRITLDIITLFEIAEAIEIEPRLLLDYPCLPGSAAVNVRNPFGKNGMLYMYHMRASTINKSVIKMRVEQDTGKVAATLFYMVKDFKEPHNCKCIYEGEMQRHDTILCYILRNYLNPVENLLVNFTVPMKHFNTLIGLISGLGGNTLVPACFPCLLSPIPLAETDDLKDSLAIPKESLAKARKWNAFTLLPEDDGP
jgi:transcriptional regulator with XRE-family HTH domain